MKMVGKLNVPVILPAALLLFPALVLASLLLVPTAALADPESTTGSHSGPYASVTEILPESYRQIDLSESGMLTIPATSDLQASTTEGTFLPGIELSGTAAQFNSTRITVNQQLTFTDDWPVGTACLDALVQKGTETNVTAKLYLDGNEQPLATYRLKADKSTSKWNSLGNLTEDVLGKVAPGEHSASIGFEVSGATEDATIIVLLRSVEFMYNSLPVMNFNLATSLEELTDEQRGNGYGTIHDMNSSKDHSVRTSGNVRITVPAGYVNEFGGAQANTSDLALDYIRGRGNSTWSTYGKRPYRFKFDNGQSLFGMGKNKHWVLLANVMDESLIRNRMTLWLGREIGLEFTPKCVPVDVVMNGEFYGSYLLCEQVRVDANRINIGEHKEGKDYHEAGYLFSCDQINEDPRDSFTTKFQATLLNVTPSYGDNSDATNDDFLSNIDERISYLRDYIQEAEDALFGEGFKNAQGKSYEDYMDLDSVIKYLWVQTLSWNGDAFGTGSTYFYKKPDTGQTQGKIYWGPLWDFDIAWGFNPNPNFETTASQFFHSVSFPWANQLFGDPSFLAEFWGCWRYVMSPALDKMTQTDGLLDQYRAETEVSWAYNKEQSIRYSGDDSWMEEGDEERQFAAPDDTRYSTSIGEVRTSITGMKSGIASYGFKGLKDSTVAVTLVLADGKQQIIYLPRDTDSPDGFFPNINHPEDMIFLGWKRSDGSFFDMEEDRVDTDMTLTACYVKKSEAIKAHKLFFGNDAVTLGLQDSFSLVWSITPFDAQDIEIAWTISDESIVTLDADFTVRSMDKPGTATITGTLPSGNSASVTVTVLDTKTPDYNDIESITVLNPNLHLAVNEYDQIRLDFQPQPLRAYAVEMDWTSSNPSVAEVNEFGVVHALKPGTAEISGVNFVTDKRVTCSVTVTKAATEKASNPIKVKKTNKVKVKAKKLKKRAVKVKAKKAFKVTGAKGKVSHKRVGISCKKKLKKQAAKKIKVSKSGKVTCKKGLKKGVYRVKVEVRAAGDASYLPATKTTTLKIVVK